VPLLLLVPLLVVLWLLSLLLLLLAELFSDPSIAGVGYLLRGWLLESAWDRAEAWLR
jgi:hypothetical protein